MILLGTPLGARRCAYYLHPILPLLHKLVEEAQDGHPNFRAAFPIKNERCTKPTVCELRSVSVSRLRVITSA